MFAKGKRGTIKLVHEKGKQLIVKERNPDSVVDTIENEATFTKLLNKHGIGPRFVRFANGELFREFVEGEDLRTWLPRAKSASTVQVLLNILQQCRKLDELGVIKSELTRPWKDIIVSHGKPILIDFERCRWSEKPKNVTQFCQFLTSTRVQFLLKQKGISLPVMKLRTAARTYKENPSKVTYAAIRQLLPTVTEFQQRVYDALEEIPRGETLSYGQLARKLGSSPRAVGQALKGNPFAPYVPCHRIVKSDGTIGGFQGAMNGAPIQKKLKLLRQEGVVFSS